MWIREVKNKNEMSRRDENHQIQVQETVAWKNGKTVFAHACSCNIFPKIIFENRST